MSRGITLPESYVPARQIGKTVETCRLLRIGCAYTPPAPMATQDAEHIQKALLEPRTASPLPLPHRIAGAIWRWC